MKTIGFIGLGLIGGSIAKAIRKYHPDYHILAYNRSKEALASAISTGIIDGVCEEMKDPPGVPCISERDPPARLHYHRCGKCKGNHPSESGGAGNDRLLYRRSPYGRF